MTEFTVLMMFGSWLIGFAIGYRCGLHGYRRRVLSEIDRLVQRRLDTSD